MTNIDLHGVKLGRPMTSSERIWTDADADDDDDDDENGTLLQSYITYEI